MFYYESILIIYRNRYSTRLSSVCYTMADRLRAID
jgi:hypothetical protein